MTKRVARRSRRMSLPSTVGDLPSFDFRVEPDVPTQVVFDEFNLNPHLPGALIARNGTYIGAVSRHKCLEFLSGLYGTEVYLNRSVSVLYTHIGLSHPIIPASMRIDRAVRVALDRPRQQLYEPLVIASEGGERVLDLHTLLLAQSRLLARTNNLLRQANRDLRQHTLELETRNEELDAYAHTVAHDLQNPLGIVVGYAELLHENHAILQDDKLLSCLHTIARGARKAANIIHELLMLAEVRKLDVRRAPLDMAGIVAEALARLADMISSHGAKVILPESGEWPIALGYAPWVEEVWVNYISNAIKYGGRPPRVELGYSKSQISSCKSQISFWVRDNGVGLLPEQRESLFTPFTRLERQRADGHGLGLSIVRRIVDKLDGQVGVESQVGQGSLFSFSLPQVPADLGQSK